MSKECHLGNTKGCGGHSESVLLPLSERFLFFFSSVLRPFFTYWASFVHILVLIISLSVYGMAPVGSGRKNQTASVSKSEYASLQLCRSRYKLSLELSHDNWRTGFSNFKWNYFHLLLSQLTYWSRRTQSKK